MTVKLRTEVEEGLKREEELERTVEILAEQKKV